MGFRAQRGAATSNVELNSTIGHMADLSSIDCLIVMASSLICTFDVVVLYGTLLQLDPLH